MPVEARQVGWETIRLSVSFRLPTSGFIDCEGNSLDDAKFRLWTVRRFGSALC
ncbi:hypothetical protein CKA32_001002 [Geitlerinema sp. FC II]|nr:hypothetical protein CKA32_001002 [Geitlerinema sp. FC II]